MPEEINRKIVDTIATYLFAPTDIAVNNLLNEGIPRSQIYNVGNTVVDAMEHYMKYTPKRFHYDEEFILCSIHRQENTDSEARLTSIAASLIAMDHKVVLPLHPRTRNKLKEYKLFGLLDMAENVNLMEPVGYLDMLDMLNACKMVLTDSGGLQEEAFILNKPCVTMRDSTERPETEEAFANILVGTDMTEILKICNGIMTDPVIYEAMTKNKHPYGNGTAASKIMEVLECETQAV
jgi:UDP-N-acetylglucosamine 2-epimerase (non-hydrolysing)